MDFNSALMDITPQESVEMGGFANRGGGSLGVHLPITCRGLALREDARACCLLALDIMDMDAVVARELKQAISGRTGVPAAHIHLHSTHTHSSIYWDTSPANARWKAATRERVIAMAERLLNGPFRPMRMSFGRAQHQLAKNRTAIPGAANDPEVAFLSLEDLEGKNRVILLNYACHPVVLGPENRLISPDFVGPAREAVEQAWGGMVLYTNGAGGNLNPKWCKQSDVKVAEHAGRELAAAVLAARLEACAPPLTLETLSGEVLLPLRQDVFSRESILAVAERESRRPTEFNNWPGYVELWKNSMLARLEKGALSGKLPLEIAALRIGPATLVFSQGEAFVEYQLALKRLHQGRPFLFVGYSNGIGGYIPTRESLAAPGYEADLAYLYLKTPAPPAVEAAAVYQHALAALLGLKNGKPAVAVC